jgi:hypothetical protein
MSVSAHTQSGLATHQVVKSLLSDLHPRATHLIYETTKQFDDIAAITQSSNAVYAAAQMYQKLSSERQDAHESLMAVAFIASKFPDPEFVIAVSRAIESNPKGIEEKASGEMTPVADVLMAMVEERTSKDKIYSYARSLISDQNLADAKDAARQ